MKLLIDTNVILDLFQGGRPGVEETLEILDYCQLQMLDGYFAVFSMPTILYILRKKCKTMEDQKNVVEAVTRTLKPVSLRSEDLFVPFKCEMWDYEDGLQVAAAERVGADYILTHNVKDFGNSTVMPITPEDFMKKVKVA